MTLCFTLLLFVFIHDSWLLNQLIKSRKFSSWEALDAAFWLDGLLKWAWFGLMLYAPFHLAGIKPSVWLLQHYWLALGLLLMFSLSLLSSRMLLLFAIIKNKSPGFSGLRLLIVTPLLPSILLYFILK
jgi:hypothetical protein